MVYQVMGDRGSSFKFFAKSSNSCRRFLWSSTVQKPRGFDVNVCDVSNRLLEEKHKRDEEGKKRTMKE